MRRGLPILLASVSAAVWLGSAAPAVAASARPHGIGARSDFNGDGLADLAIGVAQEDVDDAVDAGMVNVLYGEPDGLTAVTDQSWSQDSPGVKGTAEERDSFGWALAPGDFNGDGFADLAVGVPFEHLIEPLTDDAGQVNVLYGSAVGLSATGNQIWSQDSPGIRDRGESGDEFGSAVATGDVNGDGYADLVVGVRGETLDGKEQVGAIQVVFGSVNGLVNQGNQFITQDTGGIQDDAEPLDLFGVALAVADFNGDDVDDVAVGANGEDLGDPGSGVGDAGAVNVLFGSAGGLVVTGNQLWTQDSPGILGVAETPDLLGSALAAGDFDGDGFADLAVDAFGENVGGDDLAGSANVLYGGPSGLSADGNQFLTQDNPDIADSAEAGDHFAASLAVGDYDGDGFDDLALGADGEDIAPTTDGGAAHVVYGSAAGLDPSDSQFWTQDSANVEDATETGDAFGSALGSGNLGKTTQDDLVVGVRTEDVGTVEDAGAVNVLYGSTGGVSATADQFWSQDSQGIRDVAEPGDWFSFGGVTAG